MRMRVIAMFALFALAGCTQQPAGIGEPLALSAPTSPSSVGAESGRSSGATARGIRAGSEVLVTINGVVSLGPGFTLEVGAAASGPAGSLTGQGFDSPFRGNPAGSPPPPGYCRFDNLAGSLSGGIVTLNGSVTFSNDPSLVGTPVSLVGNTNTGAITFVFGPFTLNGTGSVRVAN